MKKYKHIPFLGILTLAALFLSCAEPVTKIVLYGRGGENGSYSTFEMTRNSTYYAFGSFDPKVDKSIRKKTAAADWVRLSGLFDAAEFDKTTSNKSMQYIDETDTNIIVETGKTSHSLLNPFLDLGKTPKTRALVRAIQQQAEKLSKEAK